MLGAVVVVAFAPPREGAASAGGHNPAQSRVDATRPSPPFQIWLADLIDEAVRRGFDRRLVDRALARLQPLPRVIRADRAQAAPSGNLDAYLSVRLTPQLVARGREMVQTHRPLLDRIEQWFGVQRRFVVAIWGAETGYGPYSGDIPVFQALATLAWEPRRAAYFRAELFDALRIVQRGHMDVESMLGSWAGAMGQPQFMPSSYLKYAYDFDRNGRRDIWGSTADTLASIANYLRSFGWRNDETWGREVAMPGTARARIAGNVPLRTDGCAAVRTMTERRGLQYWAARGVRRADGSPLPHANVDASLVTTSEERTFLVYPNYETILAYNCSHHYALSVALLADRIR